MDFFNTQENNTPFNDDGLNDDVYVFPTSFAQQRFWFLDQFEPGSPYYNIPLAIRAKGDLDIGILKRVLSEIIRRHESLRTSFFFYDGQPSQVIYPSIPTPFIFTDLRNLQSTQKEQKSKELAFSEARFSFQLQTGPLFRIHLLQLLEKEYIILLTMHHIISDGWSMSVFMREIFILYESFIRNLPSPLPDLSLQYADFTEWQRNWLSEGALEKQLSYWKNKLKDIPQVLEFPTDRPRPAIQSNIGANYSKKIPKFIMDKVSQFNKSTGVTMFMTLMSVFNVLIWRYSNQDDICIGTPIANRTRAEMESLIGLFINTLVIRTRIKKSLTFYEILDLVKSSSLEAFENQDIPFEMLVDALQPERDMSHSPIFQVMFILQNAQIQGKMKSSTNLLMEQIDLDAGTATFDITVAASEQSDGLSLSIEYNTDLFNRETVIRFLDHFEILLNGAINEPDLIIAKLPLLTPFEQNLTINEWNKTEKDFHRKNLWIHKLFEDQVEKSPDKIAVAIPEINNRPQNRISYNELNVRANILGSSLRNRGVTSDTLVAVCLDKSVEMIVSILAIIKAGGAYLPIDPLYPPERISFMLSDSGVRYVLTDRETLLKLPPLDFEVILIEEEWIDHNSLFVHQDINNLAHVNQPDNLVYMIYTSGSTGKAKGVRILHKNLVNAYLGWEHEYRLDNMNSHLQMANFSFDVFSGDFVRALCSGGKLVLCPRDHLLMPSKLFSLMLEESVDCAEFVPAVLRNLIQYIEESGQNLAFMKLLICGSDSWYSEEYKQFLKFCGPETRLINSFGLTEATIDSTYFEGSVDSLIDKQIVPIGRPFPNVRLYVLDEFMQPVPIGVKGELYIGGKGVANGYHNRPELNQEKFVSDPFVTQESSLNEGKLYRTGDATRYLADGNIEFMGRLDFQVKIRGFRIETGEIESVLRQYPGVQDVAVTSFLPGKQGDLSRPISPILVGYLTTDKLIDAIPWKSNCSIVSKRTDGSLVHINLNTLTLYENGVGVEELPNIQETETPFEIYLDLPGHEEQSVFVGEIEGNLLEEKRIQLKLVGDQFESIRRAIRILADEDNLDIPDISGGSWIIKIKAGCEIVYSENEFVEGAIERIILSNSSYYFEVRLFYPMEVPINVPVGIRTSFTEITGNKVRVNGTHIGISQGRDLIKIDLVGGIKNLINDIAWSYIKKVKINPNSVKSFLKTKLPDYMVPSIIMVIDAIPLTPNGKLDRQALPNPDWSSRDHEEEIILPRTPIEEAICGIWSQILGVDRIGVNENFFELGGHSLLATQVISRIKTNFRIDLPLKCIFESPTVASLAEQVDIYLHKAEAPVLPPIRPIPTEISHIPLSFAQQRLWFLDKLEPNSSFYNLPETVRISGDLIIGYLEMALNDVVKRHEALRTIFIEIDGVPQQIVLPKLWIPLQVDEIDSFPFEERNRKLLELSMDEVKRPFDLSKGPLLRAKIIKTDAKEYSAILTMHHIIGDAWSSRILIQELAQFYRAYVGGKTLVIPPLEIQYADFSFWQRDWLKGEVLQGELNYWKSHLAGLPQLLDLPTDFSRPTIQTFNGNFISFEVPDHIREKIKKLAVKTNTTLFMVLISVFHVFLHRYSGQDEIAVGTPIANRNKAQIENLIGFFVNTLVIKAKFAEQDDFIDLVSQLKNNTLDAYAHQELPFEMVVDALQPERNLGHSPIFQVMFTLQESQTRGIDNKALTKVGDISIIPMEVHSGTSKFDLTLFMSDEADKLGGAFEFNTDLFRFETIQRMIGHFLRLMEGITSDDTQKLWELPLLTIKERKQLLQDWNDTFFNITIEENVVTLFENQVGINPSAIAVTEFLNLGNSTWKEVEYTFLQVDQKANQLAHYLVKIGVEPEKLVGICMKRSISMVIGILATLKAGGAYLPMDPTYPIDRLTFMIEDSNCKAIITESDLLNRIHLAEGTSVHILPLDETWNEIEKEDDRCLKKEITEHQLAYVIYTSGSTGRPKGAMIEHIGLTNYLAWCRKAYPISDGVGSPVHSSISFDLTITSLFTPLISGKTVILLPEEKGIEGLSELLEKQGGFSLIKITPAHLQVLGEQIGIEKSNGRTNAFIIGGENLLVEQISLWQKGSPDTQYVNEYGPTETVVGCCVYWAPLGKQETGIIPIGRPIINTQLYVLDKHMQPLPVGIPGELYIGGLGVGRGYLNRNELTNEKFLPDIFSSTPGSRLYRTGDLVKFLPDGNLICLGRMDFQVKIRGFRIELGEIESLIRQQPGVKETCVWVKSDNNVKRLIAFIAPEEKSNPPDTSEILRAIKQELPEYMLPSAILILDALPRTLNLKIDYKKLSSIPLEVPSREEDYQEPSNDKQILLTKIWREVLRLEQIGLRDNFFELGGDSILSIQVVSQARQAGLKLTPRQIFEHQTIEELAYVIEYDSTNLITAEQGIVSGEVPLTPIQRWFFDQNLSEPGYFNQAMLLEVKGRLDPGHLEIAFNALINHHDALRMKFIQDEHKEWQEVNLESLSEPIFSVVDLSKLSESEWPDNIKKISGMVQANLDLKSGRLIKVVYFDLGEGNSARLLIVIHHLVVDGVSWRLLFEDLWTGYLQSQSGVEKILLPKKTTSFREWALRLKEYTDRLNIESVVQPWIELLNKSTGQIPLDDPYGNNACKDQVKATMNLSEDETKNLFKEANQTLSTEIDELLLSAFVIACQKTFGIDSILIELEGHGRQEITGMIQQDQPNIDLSRSVGWFTIVYPVRLVASGWMTPLEVLKTNRQTLNKVPEGGFTYSLLRYGVNDIQSKLRILPQAEIVFNYLGQIDRGLITNLPFKFAQEEIGPSQSQNNQRAFPLEINGGVSGGCLGMDIVYSQEQFRSETIQTLVNHFRNTLLDYCNTKSIQAETSFIPSDFKLSGLDQVGLDKLVGKIKKKK